MALSQVGTATFGVGTGATTFPTGWAAGDFALLAVSNNSATPQSTPAGWTLVQSGTQSHSAAVFSRVLQAGDSPPSVTASGTPDWGMVVLRGQDLVTPVPDSGVLTYATNISAVDAPSVSPPSSGAWLFTLYSSGTGSHTGTPPAGATEQWDQGGAGGNPPRSAANLEGPLASAGATGVRTETWNTTGSAHIAITVAVAVAGTIAPTGVASAEAMGSARIVQGVAPTGLATSEAFGAARLVGTVGATGIASAEAFGLPALTAQSILPAAIPTQEASWIQGVNSVLFAPAGIASGEAVGVPIVTGIVLSPTGIPTAAALGAPSTVFLLGPPGVAAGIPGVPTIVVGPIPIVVVGVASAAAVGSPVVAIVVPPRWYIRSGYGTWYSGTDLDGTYRWGPLESAFGFATSGAAQLQAGGIASRVTLNEAPQLVYLPGTPNEFAPSSVDDLLDRGLLLT